MAELTLTSHPVARSIMVTTLTGVSARHYTPKATMGRRGMTSDLTAEDGDILFNFMYRRRLDGMRAMQTYLHTLNI